MATKAQRFRTEQARKANPPKPKQPKRPRRDGRVDTSKPATSATDRKAARLETGEANLSRRAGERGGARLEKASRKSTRRSAGRMKRDTGLRRKASWAATRKRSTRR